MAYLGAAVFEEAFLAWFSWLPNVWQPRRPPGKRYDNWWKEAIEPSTPLPDNTLPVPPAPKDVETVPELLPEVTETPELPPGIPPGGPGVPPPPGGPGVPPPPLPPPTTRPKTKSVIDNLRTLRLVLRREQRGATGTTTAPGAATQTPAIPPPRAIALNARIKLQTFVANNGYWETLRNLGMELQAESFDDPTVESLQEHILDAAARYNTELSALPDILSDLMYLVDYSEDATISDGELWPIRRFGIINAFNDFGRLVGSLGSDLESLKGTFYQAAGENWKEFDTRYQQALARVAKFEQDTEDLILNVQRFSAASARQPRPVLEYAAPNEEQLVADGRTLNQRVTLVRLRTEEDALTVVQALQLLGVSETLAQQFEKNLNTQRLGARRILYMTYLEAAHENLQRLWDSYERSYSKSDRFREQRYIDAVNAVLLFGTKRVGGDKQLEQLFGNSHLADLTSALIGEILAERESGRITIDPQKLSIDTVFEGLDLDFCDHCGVNDKPLAACANCEVAFYCGRECLRAHWDQHRKRCKPLFEVARRIE